MGVLSSEIDWKSMCERGENGLDSKKKNKVLNCRELQKVSKSRVY